MICRGFSQSGGGSRIDVLLASALYVERKGYRADWRAGVSSGLLSALAMEFGCAEHILKRVMDDTLNWIPRKPITNDGKMTWWALWHIISGKNYLGVQDEMKIVREYISEQSWDVYRESGRPIYGMCVCVEDGQEWLSDLRDFTYDEMMLFVSASCRVPVWTEPVLINGKHWADGGWRDHNPSAQVIEQYEQHTTHLVSLSTRPIMDVNYPRGLLGMVNKVIGVYGMETTYEDENREEEICRLMNIERWFCRLKDCKRHPYDTDSQRSIDSVAMAMEQMRAFDI